MKHELDNFDGLNEDDWDECASSTETVIISLQKMSKKVFYDRTKSWKTFSYGKGPEHPENCLPLIRN